MADKVYEELKKNQARKTGLTENISVKISVSEMGILEKKASELLIDIEELVREYLLSTSAFKIEGKGVKKPKPKLAEKEGDVL